jgi:hypothetical protein
VLAEQNMDISLQLGAVANEKKKGDSSELGWGKEDKTKTET